MSSEKKKRKCDKRLHWGRDGKWLKPGNKVKGVSFYTSGERKKLKEVANAEN